jgi:hypothetical protein
METQIEPVVQVREWCIDRIHDLSESNDVKDYLNAVSIAEEFDEWINIPEGANELSCLVIDKSFDIGEEEIDTI